MSKQTAMKKNWLVPCLQCLYAAYSSLMILDSVKFRFVEDSQIAKDISEKLSNARLFFIHPNGDETLDRGFLPIGARDGDMVIYHVIESLFSSAVLRWAAAFSQGKFLKKERFTGEMGELRVHFFRVRDKLIAHYEAKKPEYFDFVTPTPYNRPITGKEFSDLCRIVEFSIGLAWGLELDKEISGKWWSNMMSALEVEDMISALEADKVSSVPEADDLVSALEADDRFSARDADRMISALTSCENDRERSLLRSLVLRPFYRHPVDGNSVELLSEKVSR